MIRLANQNDLDAILMIVSEAQQFIASQGFAQWTNGYPSKELFEEDIQKEGCYVMEEEDQIVGFMTLLFEEEPVYKLISWSNEEAYGVIHRTSICKERRGKKDVNKFFEFAQMKALERGICYLRIDTHPENKPMNTAIKRFGFSEAGLVYYPGNAVRIAYEKKLKVE